MVSDTLCIKFGINFLRNKDTFEIEYPFRIDFFIEFNVFVLGSHKLGEFLQIADFMFSFHHLYADLEDSYFCPFLKMYNLNNFYENTNRCLFFLGRGQQLVSLCGRRKPPTPRVFLWGGNQLAPCRISSLRWSLLGLGVWGEVSHLASFLHRL